MKRDSNDSFFRAITALASGSIIVQLITIAASPIMTRLYTTEEIGLYTLVLSIVNMFGLVLSGRYEMPIVSEKNENNIFPLIKLSGCLCILFSFVISIFFLMINIKEILDGKYVFIFLSFYIFILLLTTGFVNIITAYNNRKKEYYLMTSVDVLRTIGKNTSMIILGLFKLGSVSLLLSELIGKILGFNKQLGSLRPHIKSIAKVDRSNIKRVAKLHYRQPFYSMPAIFANTFSYSVVNFFVEQLYGLTQLGFYSMSYRVLGVPLTIISQNVSKVYFEEASREFDKYNNYKKTFFKTSLFLLVIAFFMVVCLMSFAPSLFEWFFGTGWDSAGQYVRILAPLFGIRLIVSPLSTGMLISSKQNKDLIIQVIFAAVSICLFIFSLFAKINIETYLLLMTVTNSVIYVVYYVVLLKYALSVQTENY